jgi:hypothetical protein
VQSLTSSKLDAKVTFLSAYPNKAASGPHAAVVHLFEHDYDAQTRFWYGVADVACTALQIDQDARRVEAPDPGKGFMHNPAKFLLRIQLEDGRLGLARHLSSSWESGISGEYARIVFFGESVLPAPPGRSVGT